MTLYAFWVMLLLLQEVMNYLYQLQLSEVMYRGT